jgi:hypothetical protein
MKKYREERIIFDSEQEYQAELEHWKANGYLFDKLISDTGKQRIVRLKKKAGWLKRTFIDARNMLTGNVSQFD